jgi:hypothetical protein
VDETVLVIHNFTFFVSPQQPNKCNISEEIIKFLHEEFIFLPPRDITVWNNEVH